MIQLSLRSFLHDKSLTDIIVERINWFIKTYGVRIPYVFFSGGKDSTAVLIGASKSIARERIVVVYIELLGNTHPINVKQAYNVVGELYKDIYVEVVTDKNMLKTVVLHHAYKNQLPLFLHIRATDSLGGSFWEMVRRWGCPMPHFNRLCFREFKDKWFRKLPQINGKIYNIVGVKASDSRIRRERWGRTMVNVFGNEIALSPIHDFTDDEVWAVIRENNIQLPSYKVYRDSMNCMFCPLRSFKKQQHIVKKLLENKYDLSRIRESIIYAINNCKNMKEASLSVCYKWLKAIEMQPTRPESMSSRPDKAFNCSDRNSVKN